MKFLLFWVIFGLLFEIGDGHCSRSAKSPRRQKLSLGVLLPETYRQQFEPYIKLALYHVHTDPTILPDYCIDLMFKDTHCKTSLGMKSLFDLMNVEQRPFALFGDICTNVNEPVAMASKYWDILQLSYAETHAKFSTADSKDLYPTFFRMVPGDKNLILARCHLLLNYNWTRVGTIKQSDDPRYALPHEKLTTTLENVYNVTVVYTAGISVDQVHNIGYELDELKRRDARIIIGDFSPDLAVKILCEAYQKEMFGPNYVWILHGYHQDNWWKFTEKTNCSNDEIEDVLQGHFALKFAAQRPDVNKLIISNKTVRQIKEELKSLCDRRRCQYDAYSAYAYDGIWALSMALNASLHQNGQDISPDLISSKLLQTLSDISFEGVTGKVKFQNNERLGVSFIEQWWNGSYTNIAYYDNANDDFVIESVYDWVPPPAATVVKRERQYISVYLLAIMCSLSVVGVLLALFFLLFNFKYRNHRFIKMSSPNMNNLIICGSICAYISIFLIGIDTRFVSPFLFEKLCYAKTWVLSVAFTLAFGSMFSKTWRVHSIFTNIRKDKKAIKDYQLFMIVALIMTVDAIILCLWAFISPFRFSISDHETLQSKNVLIIPELERCQSDYSIYFQVVFYVIKGMLMIFGCFLAWETRAVNVPALNDSKYIGMSVYNVVVMCVIGLSLAIVLQERVNEAFALTSFFIIFCTTLTLSFVFVPKIIELVRTPRGTEQQRYRKGMMKSVVGKNGTDNLQRQLSIVVEGIKEKICRIEEENLTLHQILVSRSAELWDNLERLRQLGESIRDHKATRNLCCVAAPITTNNPKNPIQDKGRRPSPITENDNTACDVNSALVARIEGLESENEPLIIEEFSLSKSESHAELSPTNSGGITTMVRQKQEGWPWLDPTEHTTML
uniref:G-protein coupled receptors family 3 profile domain-containing protein n=1 Tax=Panagrolaimus sp. JU765 TaxID=591449 RepID=A0AC34QA04_9BILA